MMIMPNWVSIIDKVIYDWVCSIIDSFDESWIMLILSFHTNTTIIALSLSTADRSRVGGRNTRVLYCCLTDFCFVQVFIGRNVIMCLSLKINVWVQFNVMIQAIHWNCSNPSNQLPFFELLLLFIIDNMYDGNYRHTKSGRKSTLSWFYFCFYFIYHREVALCSFQQESLSATLSPVYFPCISDHC